MKKSALYIYLLLLTFLYSCNGNAPKSSNKNAETSQCYVSTAGSDSASLVLHYNYSKIDGDLNMYFKGKDNMTGKLSGTFKGDTLFLDYNFQSGNNTEYFRNPLAFLRKDGKLYQGYGEIATAFGRSYLKKETIVFDKGFIFNSTDCK